MHTAEKPTFTGSCHCKAIKYKVAIDIKPDGTYPTAFRCNCTVCQKPSFTNLHASPSDFTLVSPSSENDVKSYSFRNPNCKRFFCDKCGIQVWGAGWYDYEGGRNDFFIINLGTIDQPQEGVDLSKFKFEYWDGLHDNWKSGKKSVPYSGGLN